MNHRGGQHALFLGNLIDDFDALEGFRATRALDSALCALLVRFIGSVVVSTTPDPSAP